MEPQDNDDEQQFQDHINSPEHQSRASSHEAGHAVLAERLGYRVINVDTKGTLVPAGSRDSMLISNGALAATGGGTEIHFGGLLPNHPEFDEVLRDIATIQMGGRAAEEMTHPPEQAQSTHAKWDEFNFRHIWQERRTREQLDFLLAEGLQRAKAFLAHPNIFKEHQRVREFLLSGRDCAYPNGEFIRRAIRGANE